MSATSRHSQYWLTFSRFGGDDAGDAASDGEVSGDAHPAGGAGGGEFIEESVGDGFVEDSLISERMVIVFEGFELDTGLVGDVF